MGEVSVYLKHLAVYAEMVEAGVPLPSSSRTTGSFLTICRRCWSATLPRCLPTATMAFFGSSGGGEAAALPNHPLYASGNGTRSMSGYLITRSCAESLSRHLGSRPIVKPIDLAINDVVRELGLVTYWSVPAIIENGSETGLFEHSLGVLWRDRRLSARLDAVRRLDHDAVDALMRFSLLHPSRNRLGMAATAIAEWTSKASGRHPIEYIVSIDRDDDDVQGYRDLTHRSAVQLLVHDNRSLVDAVNRAAERSSGDVLVVVSDDFGCPDGWDEAIDAVVGDRRDFALLVHDGYEGRIMTLPIVGRVLYARLGYIYHPAYFSMYCDDDLTALAVDSVTDRCEALGVSASPLHADGDAVRPDLRTAEQQCGEVEWLAHLREASPGRLRPHASHAAHPREAAPHRPLVPRPHPGQPCQTLASLALPLDRGASVAPVANRLRTWHAHIVFDRLYVIHCQALRKRREHTETSLRRIGWTARWVTNFDPADITPTIWRGRVSGRLRMGEVSVYLKHLAVYREMVESGIRSAFVLEDDAILPDDFRLVFEAYASALPADYDMAFLGASCGNEAAPLSEHPLYANGNGTRSMSGYLITGSCAEQLAMTLDKRPIAKPIDLTIDDIVREFGLITYWSVPAIIANGTETGLFAHSLGVWWRRRGARARLARQLGSIVGRWRR